MSSEATTARAGAGTAAGTLLGQVLIGVDFDLLRRGATEDDVS